MKLALGSSSAQIRLGSSVATAGFTPSPTVYSLSDFVTHVNDGMDANANHVFDASNNVYSFDRVSDSGRDRITIRGDGLPGSDISRNGYSITIRNATFRGGRPQTWSSVGGGIFKVASSNLRTLLNLGVNGGAVSAGRANDGRMTFFDDNAASSPLPAIYPAASTGLNSLRYTNGDQWLSAYSGSVNQGDFVCAISGGQVTGFTVSGTTKTSFDALNSSCALASMYVLVYANSNIYCTTMTYDSGTGVLSFSDSIPVTSYIDFCFIGGARNTTALLGSGEFSLDASTGDVYYRPANGDVSSAGWGEIGRMFEVTRADYDKVLFENCTFSDCNGPQLTLQQSTDEASALVSVTTVSTSAAQSTAGASFSSCNFNRAAVHLLSGRWTVDGCSFGSSVWMGAIALEGSSFTDSSMQSPEGAECVRFIRNVSGSASTAMLPVVVDNCWFTNVAAHGQPISLYQGTALSATVTNCTFVNSYRGIAIKMPVASFCTVGDELLIANNLFYVGSLPLELPSEGAIQISSGTDDTLTSAHKVRVQNNTCIADYTSLGNQSGRYARIAFPIHGFDGNSNLTNWKTGFNIAAHCSGVVFDSGGTYTGDGSGHVYNLFWEDRDFISNEASVYSSGASATGQDVNQRSAVDFSSLSVTGSATYIPSMMGIQWSTIPTSVQVSNADFCIALTKPASVSSIDSYERSAAIQARKWTTRTLETASGSSSSWTVTDGSIALSSSSGFIRGVLTLSSADASYVATNDPILRVHYSGGEELALASVTQTDSSTVTFDSPYGYLDTANVSAVYMMSRDSLL